MAAICWSRRGIRNSQDRSSTATSSTSTFFLRSFLRTGFFLGGRGGGSAGPVSRRQISIWKCPHTSSRDTVTYGTGRAGGSSVGGCSADNPGGNSRSARVASRAPVSARRVSLPLGAISFLMP